MTSFITLCSVARNAGTFIREQKLPVYGGMVILFVHFILATYGIEVANVDNYQHMVQYPEVVTNFWRALWYWHVNPPGMSIVFWLCRLIGGGDPYRTLTVVLPLAHLSAFWAFFFACKHFKLSLPQWVFVLFFFNPLLFLYYKYPYFPAFFFTTNSYILYFLSRFSTLKFYQLATLIGIIVFCALTRSVWHISFVALLVLALLYASRQKRRWWLALMLLLPLSIYVKNFYLFGQFSASSWLGMSLGRTHYPWLSAKPGEIGVKPPYNNLEVYQGLYDDDDPRIEKYRNISELNSGNWVDIRYLIVCEQFGRETKAHFDWKWSLNSVLNGWFIAMQSPADYFFFWPQNNGVEKTGKPIWNYDWLCTNRIGYKNVYFFIEMPEMWHAYKDGEWTFLITNYTVVYTILVLVFALIFFKMPFSYRFPYVILMFCMATYVLVDNAESNRMRFEVEPFFYFYILVILSRFRTGTWPWSDARKATVLHV